MGPKSMSFFLILGIGRGTTAIYDPSLGVFLDQPLNKSRGRELWVFAGHANKCPGSASWDQNELESFCSAQAKRVAS